jgi:hypothetical protein
MDIWMFDLLGSKIKMNKFTLGCLVHFGTSCNPSKLMDHQVVAFGLSSTPCSNQINTISLMLMPLL